MLADNPELYWNFVCIDLSSNLNCGQGHTQEFSIGGGGRLNRIFRKLLL